MRKGKKANGNGAVMTISPSVNSRSVEVLLSEHVRVENILDNRAPTISENCIAIYTRADVLLTRARAIEQRLSGTGSTDNLTKPDANNLPLSQVLHGATVTLSVLDQTLDAICRGLGIGEE